MLQKESKPLWKKTLRGSAIALFVAEALAFAGSYAVWHQLNTSRGNLYEQMAML